MRLVTCRFRGQPYLGMVAGESVVIPGLSPDCPRELASMLGFIEGGPACWQRLVGAANSADWSRLSLAEVELLAPIPRPRKNVMCLGWNYAEHVEESASAQARAADLPEHPVVFTKAVTSVSGPYADIPYDPRVSVQMDWEAELGVVLGVGGRHIALENALGHVFGYTVVNDISARDVQFRHQQFFLGKSLDGGCPMGPWIVTTEEIADPQALEVRSRVNGVLKQAASTRTQIFDVAKVISILSGSMTLEAGDIIATGTPSGVGFARRPPEWLRAGDTVECEVTGIGAIRNRLVAV